MKVMQEQEHLETSHRLQPHATFTYHAIIWGEEHISIGTWANSAWLQLVLLPQPYPGTLQKPEDLPLERTGACKIGTGGANTQGKLGEAAVFRDYFKATAAQNF